MNPDIEKLVAEYKEKLDKAGATFLLVYAYKQLGGVLLSPNQTTVASKDVCQISSNSSKEGIRAILHAILTPTKETVDLMAKAFHTTVVAAVGVTETALTAANKAGVFHEAARNLLDHMRPHWTIKGWENDKPRTPAS
jgi:hypothetical protein